MKINIICIGSIKDNNLALLIKEYSNKISNFNKLEIIELKEITYKDESEQNINLSLAKEQEQIIKYLDESYNIALCIEGQQLDTIAFSNIFSDCFNHKSYLKQMNFIIGSSHGLSEQVKAKCDLKLSFSKMTFPHQLMRLILLEQIYRAFCINNNIKYHK